MPPARLRFTGTLTNSLNIFNSVAIGVDALATKPNQVVIGGSAIVETLLRGVVRGQGAEQGPYQTCGYSFERVAYIAPGVSRPPPALLSFGPRRLPLL